MADWLAHVPPEDFKSSSPEDTRLTGTCTHIQAV